MLKNKIARLERENAAGGTQSSASSRFKTSVPKNVDAKAEDELISMSQERQQAVEVSVCLPIASSIAAAIVLVVCLSDYCRGVMCFICAGCIS